MAAVLSSDWQSGKTLSECFGHVFESSIASDVTFIVGIDKERISAHKLVLFSRSPVFYAMFEGPLAEQGEITIPDISEEIFRMFLRYLYTDTMHLSVETVVPILYVARKYCVDILVSCCEEFLKKNLSVQNSCQLLELAHVFVMDDLKAECLQLIVDLPTVIFQSQSFLDLGSNCLTIITESDDLSADEIDVYKAVISWAKAECERQKLEKTPSNLHHVLGAILYNVRFPVMDHEFFLKEVCYDKVLPAEDVVQVINYHHHKAGQEEISNSKFNHNNRKYSRREILWRRRDR
ncbi:BTB/POZ domain-containing protein 6-like [Ylistrum balloti]|uniref:BTB/POZ domain-containing protein 6-like n=1 Tax=Ylistrum balloti TaxID=509963 RepID=UPI002905AE67|nr:BTB/POZ domain-containing protein 6-like [Ylistrum balloti]